MKRCRLDSACRFNFRADKYAANSAARLSFLAVRPCPSFCSLRHALLLPWRALPLACDTSPGLRRALPSHALSPPHLSLLFIYSLSLSTECRSPSVTRAKPPSRSLLLDHHGLPTCSSGFTLCSVDCRSATAMDCWQHVLSDQSHSDHVIRLARLAYTSQPGLYWMVLCTGLWTG